MITYDGTREMRRRHHIEYIRNNKSIFFVCDALRAFILSRLIVCTFGIIRRFISDLKAVFDGVL